MAVSQKGGIKRYPYYHCKAGCKTRFKAEVINEKYEDKLKAIKISAGVSGLFELVLKDININTQIGEHLADRNSLLKQIKEQELFIGKARKLFVAGKIELDDFSKLKKEYVTISGDLSDELNKVTIELRQQAAQFVKVIRQILI